MSGLWKHARRFIFHRVLHADDTPHRIALGVAIATLVAFSPLLGLHTVLALAIAAAFRANKAVCIPLVWITNPFTAAPIYYYCWKLGAGILPNGGPANVHAAMDRMAAAGVSEVWPHIFEWSFWQNFVSQLFSLGVELWLGCMIVGVLAGGVFYGLTFWGVSAYRRRRVDRRLRRNERRQARFLRQPPRRAAVGCRESV